MCTCMCITDYKCTHTPTHTYTHAQTMDGRMDWRRDGWMDGGMGDWMDGWRDWRTDRSWAIDGSSRAFDQALENHCVCQDASSSCPVVGNVAGGSWPQRPSQRFSEPTGCWDLFSLFSPSRSGRGGRLPLWSIFAPEMRGSSSLSCKNPMPPPMKSLVPIGSPKSQAAIQLAQRSNLADPKWWHQPDPQTYIQKIITVH